MGPCQVNGEASVGVAWVLENAQAGSSASSASRIFGTWNAWIVKSGTAEEPENLSSYRRGWML